jgi:hypothetical protein
MKKRAYIQAYISFYRTALLGPGGIGIKGLKQVSQNLSFSWLTFSYTLYKEIYEELEFTGRGQGI